MKRLILALLLTSTVCSSAYADKVFLYLRNESDTPMVVEKPDGTHIDVPAHGYIPDQIFEYKAKVKNFMNGKYVCEWYVRDATDMKMRIVGLDYRLTSYGAWECNDAFILYS